LTTSEAILIYQDHG